MTERDSGGRPDEGAETAETGEPSGAAEPTEATAAPEPTEATDRTSGNAPAEPARAGTEVKPGLTEDDARMANPAAESVDRLAGDMGISSERTTDDLEGIEGTGTLGSAQGTTDGASAMTDNPLDPPSSEDNRHHQQQAAEENPAEVPSHESDPSKNPGHSHG